MSQSGVKMERIDAFLRDELWVETEAGLGQLFAEDFQKSDLPDALAGKRVVRMALGVIVHMLRQQKNLSASSLGASVGLELYDVLRVERDTSFVPSVATIVNLARVLDVKETAFLRLAGHRQVDDATVSTAYKLINLADELEGTQAGDRLPRIQEALKSIS